MLDLGEHLVERSDLKFEHLEIWKFENDGKL